jgi:hypothetical protein
MKKILCTSDNCNTWNTGNSGNISEIGLECSSCSSFGNFSLSYQYFIWRWEVDIPYDWEYGQWERIRLYPVQVKILIVKCLACGEEYRIYPSFILPGTTLTISALIFVAFVYETSELTWRDIPEKCCTEEDRISHSTLYKAVHGLGKSMLVQEEKIREGVKKLHAACLLKNESALPGCPRMKALYDHTRERECAVHKILLPLSHHCLTEQLFSRAFYTYLRPLHLIFSSLSPPIAKIYKK